MADEPEDEPTPAEQLKEFFQDGDWDLGTVVDLLLEKLTDEQAKELLKELRDA